MLLAAAPLRRPFAVRYLMISSISISNSSGSSGGSGKRKNRREFKKPEESKVTMPTPVPMPAAAMAIKPMPTPTAMPPPTPTPTKKNKDGDDDNDTCNKPSAWTPLGLSRDELTLDYTLPTGQSFRWRKTGFVRRRRGKNGNDGGGGGGGGAQRQEAVFTGVVGRRLVQLAHVGEGGQAAFRVLVDKSEISSSSSASSSSAKSAALEELRDYFNAGVALSPMASRWASDDARWRSAARVACGARVLRQPPLECLLSFVCSSNNSIPRITGMVEHLARRYGTELASAGEAAELLQGLDDDDDDEFFVKKEEQIDDDGAPSTPSSSSASASASASGASASLSLSGAPPRPDAPFYAFPTLDQLAGKVAEADLRDAGFGYRAKYIAGAVEALAATREERRRTKEKGEIDDEDDEDDFLLSLRTESQERALEELTKLPGVGPKVAACVALFSLDKHAVVPVDTHVWQLAARHYLPSIRGKAFSPAAGHLVSTALAERFGPFAGWAHNALFIAELPGVRDEVARREREERRREKRKGKNGDDDKNDDDDIDDDESDFDDSDDDEPKPKPAAKKRTTMAARRAEESAAVLSEMNKPGTPSKEV